MSRELDLPESFQTALSAIYEGEFVPYCHAADSIHSKAVNILRFRSDRKRVSNGSRLWVSSGDYRGNLDGMDVIYSLATERHMTRSRRIKNQLIHLCINGNLAQPGALIVPADDIRVSASVIVGDIVNDPEHLIAVENIVDKIHENSPLRGYVAHRKAQLGQL